MHALHSDRTITIAIAKARPWIAALWLAAAPSLGAQPDTAGCIVTECGLDATACDAAVNTVPACGMMRP